MAETKMDRGGPRRWREREVNKLDSQSASRRKVQTWGGGRDSGLGGRVMPTEPPSPNPTATRPPPPLLLPRWPPYLRQKGGGQQGRWWAAGHGEGAWWNACRGAAGGRAWVGADLVVGKGGKAGDGAVGGGKEQKRAVPGGGGCWRAV